MSDLISRAEALKYIPPEEPISRMVIAQLPTIEAEPIKHGRWEEYSAYDNSYRCSVCGEVWSFIEGTPEDNVANFCPNCGARIDEVEE